MSTVSARQTDPPSAPTGIKIICVLGGIFAALGLLIGLLATAGGAAGLGLLLLAISGGQLAVLYGLWTLQAWGWYGGLLFYGVDALIDMGRGEPFAALVALLILVYVASKYDYYL